MAINTSWILVLSSCLCAVSAGTGIAVEWSVDGVAQYQNSPLQVNLGDTIIFRCVPGSYSNVYYMNNMDQYTNCNGTNDDGSHLAQETRIGFCDEDMNGKVENFSAPITQHSNNLGNLQFSPNMEFYFASFSNGSGFIDAISTITVNGQCLDGLRLRIHVNEALPPTVPTDSTPGGGGGGSSGGLTSPLTESQVIIVAVVCSVGVIIVLVVSIVVCVVCIKFKCCGCAKNKKSVSFENGAHTPDGPDNDSTAVHVRAKGPGPKGNKANGSQNKPKNFEKIGNGPAHNDSQSPKSDNKLIKTTDNKPPQRQTDGNELNERNRRMTDSNGIRNDSAKGAPAEKKPPTAGNKPANSKNTAANKPPGSRSKTTKPPLAAAEPARNKNNATTKPPPENKITATKPLPSSTISQNKHTSNKNNAANKPLSGPSASSRPSTAENKPTSNRPGGSSKQQVNRTSSGGPRRPAPGKPTATNGNEHSALSRRSTLPSSNKPDGTRLSTPPVTSSVPVTGVQTRGAKKREQQVSI